MVQVVSVMKFVIFLTLLLATVISANASKCRGFDKPCEGKHGFPGNCCKGLYCHKTDPTWAQGRCYHKSGK